MLSPDGGETPRNIPLERGKRHLCRDHSSLCGKNDDKIYPKFCKLWQNIESHSLRHLAY